MQYHQKSENKQERSDVICLFNVFESVKIRLENVKIYKQWVLKSRRSLVYHQFCKELHIIKTKFCISSLRKFLIHAKA